MLSFPNCSDSRCLKLYRGTARRIRTKRAKIMYSWVAFVRPAGSHPKKGGSFSGIEWELNVILFWAMAGLLAECRYYPDRNKSLGFILARREFFFMLMQLFLFNLIIRSTGLPSLFPYPTRLLWTLNLSLPCPSLLFLALLSSSLLLFSPPTSLLFFSPLFPHSKHIPLPKKIKGEANAPDWWTGSDPVKRCPSIRPLRSPG